MNKNIIMQRSKVKIINIKSRRANNLKDKIFGLIGENSLKPLFLQTRFGIHTFGVKFPIDVLILDKEFNVIKIKKNLDPDKLFFWNPLYDNVLELPVGTISKLNIGLGDKIHIQTIT